MGRRKTSSSAVSVFYKLFVDKCFLAGCEIPGQLKKIGTKLAVRFSGLIVGWDEKSGRRI